MSAPTLNDVREFLDAYIAREDDDPTHAALVLIDHTLEILEDSDALSTARPGQVVLFEALNAVNDSLRTAGYDPNYMSWANKGEAS